MFQRMFSKTGTCIHRLLDKHLHPGPGLTQPSILECSVNEYRLQLGRKGRYVRCCLVRAMYLSASVVAV